MTQPIDSPVLVITPDAAQGALAQQIASGLGHAQVHYVAGDIATAIAYLTQTHCSPHFIFMDAGSATEEIIAPLDALAALCNPGTKLVMAGSHTEPTFVEQLKGRGVAAYLSHPASPESILAAFQASMQPKAAPAAPAPAPSIPEGGDNAAVFAFMSAAAGDGSSTLAVNTAYALSQGHKKRTILVDMDYQFGMVARNLAVQSPFGIREIFDHSERTIDATLVQRMASKYSDHLDIISAPNDLRFPPAIKPETIRDLVDTLRSEYEIIVLDIPHVWSTWTSAACSNADHLVITAQLWLKSVTHASRLINGLRETGMTEERLHLVVNRSGSKYKEAVTNKDFERVCNMPITHAIRNDIKHVVEAEQFGKTILEQSNSELANELRQLAHLLLPLPQGAASSQTVESNSPLSFLKKLT